MTIPEIEKSLEVIRNNRHGVTWDEKSAAEYREATGVLMDVAKAVIEAKVPEERDEEYHGTDPFGQDRNRSFNEALRLCRLALLKDKMRVEEYERTPYNAELQLRVKDLEEALRKIVSFQSLYEKNTRDLFPGNKYYADMGMEVVSCAKSALANVKQGREGWR